MTIQAAAPAAQLAPLASHPLGPLAPLTGWPQFVVALRSNKAPLDPRTLFPADAHDPANWLTYEASAAIAAAAPATFGVGFVLTAAAGFWCLDIDGALQADRTWHPLAHTLCQSLPGAVVEVSQSGAGLHIWGRGPVPPHGKKATHEGVRLELYSEARYIMLGTQQSGTLADQCPQIAAVAARYFPPTSSAGAVDVPDDGPRADWSGPTDDDELLDMARRSRSAAAAFGERVTLADLFDGNTEALTQRWPAAARGDGLAHDASSADAALAAHLAYWTGCDRARMDRLMRRSALAREKYERGDYLPRTIGKACTQQREVLQRKARDVTPVAAGAAGLSFLGASQGAIPATLEAVFDTLTSPESGIRIAADEFQDQIMLARDGAQWVRFTDAHYGRLRAEFGRRGFKPISAEIMKTAVLMAAEDHRFDSAKDWANSLQWDGKPRVDLALPAYYRTADTPYTRAVGAYLFTALAGRALAPGCQADMVPVLIGMQGARKTSAVQALCPDPQFFAEINLKKIDDDNMARHVRGKLVAEIAELRGLLGRDQESVKAWITRRDEVWCPKWREFETRYPRRLVFIGTTNEREFLDDPTGERRWLPVVAGSVDVEALERDREQLWAEGVARFKANGIAWRDAETLARGEHAKYKVSDPWQEPVEQWLALPVHPGGPPNGAGALKLSSVAFGALLRHASSLTRAEELRLGKVLRNLGFEKTDGRLDGKVGKVWARGPLPLSP